MQICAVIYRQNTRKAGKGCGAESEILLTAFAKNCVGMEEKG